MPATFMPFSSQTPTLDTYHGGLAGICNWESWRNDEIETGHLNFVTATLTGVISGGADHSQWSVGDDDLSISLDLTSAMSCMALPDIQPAIYHRARVGPIEAEMTYGLTLGVNNLPLTGMWARLNDGVPNAPFSGVGDTATTINGHRAIMTGLMGLDMVHLFNELHPIYAMVIQENPVANQTADDMWAVLAHRLGNEGSCSNVLHDAGTSQFVFEIMPPPQFIDPQTGFPNAGVTATLGNNTNMKSAFVNPSGFSLSFPILQPGPNGQFDFFPGDSTHGAIIVLTVPETGSGEIVNESLTNFNLVMGEVGIVVERASDSESQLLRWDMQRQLGSDRCTEQ